ncbi:ATP-binding cassette sub- F member 1 [Perkinsus olseni]|uniref:ATP-binding cassette sub- F member 1 n=1 Tax=Perkinsus olseni TaxID=32597 RepID=A0A7J6MRD1_PEROL|nr:ATP-binding cassette sub- F member 1 [Perkinsus olseni]
MALGSCKLDNITYSGRPPYILNHVEFGVDCTSRIAVVGANGSGKSTFLKLLTSELEPTEGEIMANHGLRVELFSQHFEEKLDLALTPVEQILQVGPGSPRMRSLVKPTNHFEIETIEAAIGHTVPSEQIHFSKSKLLNQES